MRMRQAMASGIPPVLAISTRMQDPDVSVVFGGPRVSRASKPPDPPLEKPPVEGTFH